MTAEKEERAEKEEKEKRAVTPRRSDRAEHATQHLHRTVTGFRPRNHLQVLPLLLASPWQTRVSLSASAASAPPPVS